MSNKPKQQNDAILAIRMPAKLLTQLDALAKVKYLGVSTMARNALAQYLIDEAPEALIGASTAPQVQIRQPQRSFSPSQQREQSPWTTPEQMAEQARLIKEVKQARGEEIEDDWY